MALPTLMDVLSAAPATGPAPNTTGSFIGSALTSGVQGAAAGLGNAAAAGAKLLGLDSASQGASDFAKRMSDAAAASGRSDIEGFTYAKDGVGGLLKKGVYSAIQGVPLLAGTVGGAALAGLALPEEAAIAGGGAALAGVARAGAFLPRLLGGAGVGLGEAASSAELATGLRAATGIGTAAALQIPQSVGGLYAKANQDGTATKADAAKAIALGIPVGALQSLAPAGEAAAAKSLSTPLAGGILSRVGKGAMFNAAAGAVGAGAQTAAEGTFEPNKSAGEKAEDIVSSAVGGAISGGLMGGLFGLLPHAGNDDIARTVDQQLADPQSPSTPLVPQRPDVDPTQLGGGQVPDLPQGPQQIELPFVTQRMQDGQQAGLFDPGETYGTTPGYRQAPKGIAFGPNGERFDPVTQLPRNRIPEPTDELPTQQPNIGDALPASIEHPADTLLQLAKVRVGNAGKLRDFIDDLKENSPSLVDVHQRVEDAIEKQEPVTRNAQFVKLTEALGITDENGMARDLPKEIAEATDPAEKQHLTDLLTLKQQADDARTRNAVEPAKPGAAEEPEEPAQAGVTEPVEPGELPEGVINALQEPSPTDGPVAGGPEGRSADGGGDEGLAQPPGEGGEAQAPVGQSGPADVPQAASRIDPATGEPKSLSDRIKDEAQALAPKGGPVSIAALRERFSDVSKKDFDNAVRDVHGDDSEFALGKASKPGRGADGVKLADQPGLQHQLNVPEPEAPAAQPGVVNLRQTREGGNFITDSTGAKIGDMQKVPGGFRATDINGTEIGTAPTLAKLKDAVETWHAKGMKEADANSGVGVGNYPGDALAAKMLNVTPPKGLGDEAGAAVSQRLQLMWQKAGRNEFDPAYAALHKEAEAVTGDPAKNPATRPDGTAIARGQSPFEAMMAKRQAEAKARTLDPNAMSKTGPIMGSKAMATAAAKTNARYGERPPKPKTPTDPVQTTKGTELPKAAIGIKNRDIAEAPAAEPQPVPEPVQQTIPGLLQEAEEPTITGPRPLRDPATGLIDTSKLAPYADAQKWMDAATAKFAPEYRRNIVMARDANAWPAELKRSVLLKYGPDGLDRVNAAKIGDKVYLRADRVRDQVDVERWIAHEAVGHMATSARYPDSSAHEATLASIWDRAGGFDGVREIARKFGVWDAFSNNPERDGRGLNQGGGLAQYFSAYENARITAGNDLRLTPQRKAYLVDELIAQAAGSLTNTPRNNAIKAIVATLKVGVTKVLKAAGLHNYARESEKWGVSETAKFIEDNRAFLTQQPKGTFDLSAAAGDGHFMADSVSGTARDAFLNPMQALRENAEGMHTVVSGLAQRIDKLPKEGIKALVREGYGQIQSGYGMARLNQKEIPSMMAHFQTLEKQQGIQDRHNILNLSVNQREGDFKVASPKAWELVNKLKNEATFLNLDPKRAFSEHTWLRDETPERYAELRSKHAEMVQDVNRLNQGFGKAAPGAGMKIYDDAASLMRTNHNANIAMYLHNTYRELFGAENLHGYDPAERFAGAEGVQMHENVDAAETYWKAERDRLVKSGLDFATKSISDPNYPARGDARELLDTIKGMQQQIENQGQGPYFPLGRTGDYHVAFKVNTGPDGKASPAALSALQASLEKHFGDVTVNSLGKNNQLFARFESLDRAQAFHDHVAQNLTSHIVDGREGVFSGPIGEGAGIKGAIPLLERHMTEAAAGFDRDIDKTTDPEAKRYLEAQKTKYMTTLRATIMDTAGQNSIRGIMSKRMEVQGYNNDMLDNQVRNGQIMSSSIAHLSQGLEARQQMENMRDTVREARRLAPAESNRIAQAARLYTERQDAAQVRTAGSWADQVRSVMHTYTLAGSPGYAMLNVGQLGTLTMPELAKKAGFAKASLALIQSGADTAKLMAAVVKAGNFTSGGITPKVLDLMGMSAADKAFVLGQAARGNLELSSFARVQSGLGMETGKVIGTVGKIARFGNATALMAEISARFASMMAAKRLYEANPERYSDFKSVDDYASHVVAAGTMKYGTINTPKLFTQGGTFGAAGQIAGQFHTFSTQLFEKLHMETYNAFANGASASEKAEARTYLKAHLAAVTVLGGALGLPAAGMAAGLATKLSGIFNDGQDYDVQAHFRHFLSSMLGDKLGEVVAHGVPHFVNADLSDLSDEGLAPFGKLIEDRRKFEDAAPSYLASAWGAAPAAGINLVLGARDITNGRVLQGMSRILPVGMRNVAKAYSISQHGYTDSQGRPLPGTSADAVDVIKQALGFDSAEAEEAKERARAVSGARDDREFRSGNIKQNLARALESGDTAGAQKWYQAASAYDQDPMNLGQPIMGSIPGYLANRQKAIAYGRATGRPLGVAPSDIALTNLTKY